MNAISPNAKILPASLVFEGITLSITDQDGRPWLTLTEVARALYGIDATDNVSPKGSDSSVGTFKNAIDATWRTFKRHADVFTSDESALIDLPTAGGMQKARVFSPRGCRLMGMVSRAPKAKPFCKWVLDGQQPQLHPGFRSEKTRIALPGGPTIEQQDAVKSLVKGRVEALPHDKWKGATIQLWSSIKSKFGVPYKEIPAANFAEVLSLVARAEPKGDSIAAIGADIKAEPPFCTGCAARAWLNIPGADPRFHPLVDGPPAIDELKLIELWREHRRTAEAAIRKQVVAEASAAVRAILTGDVK